VCVLIEPWVVRVFHWLVSVGRSWWFLCFTHCHSSTLQQSVNHICTGNAKPTWTQWWVCLSSGYCSLSWAPPFVHNIYIFSAKLITMHGCPCDTVKMMVLFTPHPVTYSSLVIKSYLWPSCSHIIRVKKNGGSSQRSRLCSIEQVCQGVKSTIKHNPGDCILYYVRNYLYCHQKMTVICCTIYWL